MKYDFTSIIERDGKDAIAVEGLGTGGAAPEPPEEGFDFIPMWVADMNFATVPTITQEIARRISHPLFGYFVPSKEYYDSIIRWQKIQNKVEGLMPEHIGYDNGVVGGVINAISCYAAPGDKVLVHSPTYIGFTNSCKSCGYHLVHSELVKDENGIYRMDYEDMEKKLKEQKIHVAIFCSPHNPTGRVWEEEEIRRAMEIYERNHVTVISDEIWSDLTLKGRQHIPTQSVSPYARDNTIAIYAPTKTFNLAGLEGSYHIIYNEAMRDRVDSNSVKTHYNSMNVLSMHALIGAYQQEGYEWLDELRQVLSENVDYACDFLNHQLEDLEVTVPEGTYMLFVDCSKWCAKHQKTIEEVLRAGWKVGVGWQNGVAFRGACHIRINLALPKSRIEEAMRRLKEYVFV